MILLAFVGIALLAAGLVALSAWAAMLAGEVESTRIRIDAVHRNLQIVAEHTDAIEQVVLTDSEIIAVRDHIERIRGTITENIVSLAVDDRLHEKKLSAK